MSYERRRLYSNIERDAQQLRSFIIMADERVGVDAASRRMEACLLRAAVDLCAWGQGDHNEAHLIRAVQRIAYVRKEAGQAAVASALAASGDAPALAGIAAQQSRPWEDASTLLGAVHIALNDLSEAYSHTDCMGVHHAYEVLTAAFEDAMEATKEGGSV